MKMETTDKNLGDSEKVVPKGKLVVLMLILVVKEDLDSVV